MQALERTCATLGYPRTIRVDQGSEFVSRDLDLWAYTRGVTLDFSRPGKPTDNAYIEAFNGRFRAECLNAHWFLTLADAREKMEDWRRYCSSGDVALPAFLAEGAQNHGCKAASAELFVGQFREPIPTLIVTARPSVDTTFGPDLAVSGWQRDKRQGDHSRSRRDGEEYPIARTGGYKPS